MDVYFCGVRVRPGDICHRSIPQYRAMMAEGESMAAKKKVPTLLREANYRLLAGKLLGTKTDVVKLSRVLFRHEWHETDNECLFKTTGVSLCEQCEVWHDGDLPAPPSHCHACGRTERGLPPGREGGD